MNWNEKLQLILDYVEDHLQRREEALNRDEMAKMAGCSFSMFQKVFAYMNDISFSDYVRNRKLTLAGYDLKSSKIKIIDLSYKYGYDSPTSFTKAFHQFHGVTPSEARKQNVELRVCPKMCVSGCTETMWRLEKKPSMRLIGKGQRISRVDNKHFQTIPAFWNECQQNGTTYQLIQMNDEVQKGIVGLCDGFDETDSTMNYKIMTASSKELKEDWCEVLIPEQTWAVFDCYGRPPESIHKGWNFLYNEWLVKYPFKHADCPEIEWYSNGNVYAEDYLSQIWIPIIEEEE